MSSLAEFELACRRAPKRALVLIMLSSLSEASPRALAFACGIDTRRLQWIMQGHPPYYRTELGLITLGLAIRIKTDNGWMYAITEKGRRKARQLTARSARRAIARAATAKRTFAPMDAAAVAWGDRAKEHGLDAPTASFTWSHSCGRI